VARREGPRERPQGQPPDTYGLAHPSSVGCFEVTERRGSGGEVPEIRRPGRRWEGMAEEVGVTGGGEIGSWGRERCGRRSPRERDVRESERSSEGRGRGYRAWGSHDRTVEFGRGRLDGHDGSNDDHQSALSVKRPTPI
jgi:hypothetical protein